MLSTMKKVRPRLLDPREIDLKPISEDPRHRAAADELAAIERRLAEAEAREKQAKLRAQGKRTGRALADRAKDLLAGGRVQGIDPEREIEAAREEGMILREAIRQAAEKLDDVAQTISLEIGRQLAEQNVAALKAAEAALRDLAVAGEAFHGLRAAMLAQGYRPNEVNMPGNFPGSVWAGGLDRLGSAANMWLEYHRARGLL